MIISNTLKENNVIPSISYAITACNEHVELDRLLSQLTEHIRPEDEIIVQMDTPSLVMYLLNLNVRLTAA